MKIHKLPILGALIGLSVIVASFIKWNVIWNGTGFFVSSKFIFGACFGFYLILFSYVYNWMRNKDESDKKMINTHNALVTWWQKTEKDEIKRQALEGLEL